LTSYTQNGNPYSKYELTLYSKDTKLDIDSMLLIEPSFGPSSYPAT